MSTLSLPPVPICPKADAVQLHRAFKGLGCDAKAVINIVAHRDAAQRSLIQHEYKELYSEDLLKRLTSELHGRLETAMLMWMHDPAGRDALVVRKGLLPAVIDLDAATEVICSRTPSQIQLIKEHYQFKFGVSLEQDIGKHTSSHHKKLLLAYVGTLRYEGFEVDMEMAVKDAKDLYEAGEKRWGTDEKTFIRIFSERSGAHLATTSTVYQDMYGGSLEKAVKSKTYGKFQHGLLTILKCSVNPSEYFAKVLRKATKGNCDLTLMRVIVTRTEYDMQYIKAEYLRKYKKTLNDAVQSATSGHYRTFLLALLGQKC
ncbi:ANNEXIN ARABIDOPSIS THALIANA 5, annexin 5 [Hibiscus trionum]|uniref:Annexin n=1 Tax=Hibiscus trionum TaxID=183268 RepID=A0A9W7LQ95_HIBTR|nr:ANNEXIN ARABIDOPSIS THALIANA 5, annexin 5 [Hibiscus trionum]